MSIIAETVREFKRKLGYSTEECAERCCVSVSTLKKIMNGSLYNPRFDIMCAIADGFGVPVDAFRDRKSFYVLSLEECHHMAKFRTLPYESQVKIKQLIDQEYEHWCSLYSTHEDYGLRLKLRRECAYLPLTRVRELLETLEKEKKENEKTG